MKKNILEIFDNFTALNDDTLFIYKKKMNNFIISMHVYVYEQDVYVYISTNDKEISKVEFSDVDEINFIESIFKIKSKYLTYDLNFYTMESFVSFNL